jgi:hypothetical protein
LKQEEKAIDFDMQALLTKSREGKKVLSDQNSGNSFLQKIKAWHDEITKIDSALTFGNIPKSQ